MKRTAFYKILATAAMALLAGGGWTTARAQDADDLKRGVARISLMNGDVTVRRGDSGDWVAAAPNAPVTALDRIDTGPSSRAEIQFDSGNFLRLGSNADINVAELEYQRSILQLGRGTMTFRVLRETGNDIEIDTPSVSVRPSHAGAYRISVNENGETEVTARSGSVEVFTPRGSQAVTAGQTMMARGTASDPEFQMAQAVPYDDWDRWNDSRDQALSRSASVRYVPQDIYGAEDLDNNGQWVNQPEYGMVWQPNVAVGWAPYRYGRWVWLDWYGWTWVSSDPWGWAPYHYGSWFYASNRWCWYPGPGRHYWAPARVAFFGYGGGVGVSVGFGYGGWGNVGWVPLGPREHFNPWWGRNYYGGYHNAAYVNRSVNINNNVNITNVYRNARVNNGVTVVNANDFSHGRFNNFSQVNGNDLRSVNLVRGQMPAAPGDVHLRYSDRTVAQTPVSNANQRFFSRRQPDQVQRVPFADQRQSLAQVSRVPVPERSAPSGASTNSLSATPQARGDASGRGIRGSSVPQAESQAPANRSINSDSGSRGWRRFGDPSGAASRGTSPSVVSPAPAAPVQRNNNAAGDSRGWRRFGEPTGGSSPNTGGQSNASPAAPVQRYGGNSSNEGRGGQRFGTPSGTGSAPQNYGNGRDYPVQPQVSPNRDNGSRGNGRNDTPARQPQAAPRTENAAPRSETPRNNYSPSQRSPERYNAPSAPRQESIRIAPPVVRERSGGGNSAPRVERSGGNSSGGSGGGHSGGHSDSGSHGSRSR